MLKLSKITLSGTGDLKIESLAKRKQIYWIVKIQQKDILDTLHRLGLINQVSFYTLIYQTQSRIYETSTSKVEMAIEL